MSRVGDSVQGGGLVSKSASVAGVAPVCGNHLCEAGEQCWRHNVCVGVGVVVGIVVVATLIMVWVCLCVALQQTAAAMASLGSADCCFVDCPTPVIKCSRTIAGAVPCSGAGLCDYASGSCACNVGFAGPACSECAAGYVRVEERCIPVRSGSRSNAGGTTTGSTTGAATGTSTGGPGGSANIVTPGASGGATGGGLFFLDASMALLWILLFLLLLLLCCLLVCCLICLARPSDDAKLLAAETQDRMVRVWACVNSSVTKRRSHRVCTTLVVYCSFCSLFRHQTFDKQTAWQRHGRLRRSQWLSLLQRHRLRQGIQPLCQPRQWPPKQLWRRHLCLQQLLPQQQQQQRRQRRQLQPSLVRRQQQQRRHIDPLPGYGWFRLDVLAVARLLVPGLLLRSRRCRHVDNSPLWRKRQPQRQHGWRRGLRRCRNKRLLW